MTNQRHINSLEVVLKTVERCNLNCSYCYFFNGGDESYKKHPPLIKMETIEKIADFLLQGSKELNLKRILIDFHGGEPLMQPVLQFEEMCKIFQDTLGQHVELIFALQTNGTIFSEKYLECLAKYKVNVGISCDGPAKYHDVFRLDLKGKGSHERVAQNIHKFQQAVQDKIIPPIGILCVINPEFDAKTIYHHFTRDFGVTFLDFMLPNYTYDSFVGSVESYANYLCDLFEAWVEDDDPSINVRIIKNSLNLLTGKGAVLSTAGPLIDGYETITIASSGELGPDDALRSASGDFLNTEMTIWNSTLKELVAHPLFNLFEDALSNLHGECETCEWKNICEGGYLINRYSKENQFHNPSLLCHALKQFYSRIRTFLIENGFPKEKINEILKQRMQIC
ncbi:MAG TPA: radical SAM protein [Parachlamydiaceae bacterium]|nr:radical SAM protein [Parachlamydiaceae bacterium]